MGRRTTWRSTSFWTKAGTADTGALAGASGWTRIPCDGPYNPGGTGLIPAAAVGAMADALAAAQPLEGLDARQDEVAVGHGLLGQRRQVERAVFGGVVVGGEIDHGDLHRAAGDGDLLVRRVHVGQFTGVGAADGQQADRAFGCSLPPTA